MPLYLHLAQRVRSRVSTSGMPQSEKGQQTQESLLWGQQRFEITKENFYHEINYNYLHTVFSLMQPWLLPWKLILFQIIFYEMQSTKPTLIFQQFKAKNTLWHDETPRPDARPKVRSSLQPEKFDIIRKVGWSVYLSISWLLLSKSKNFFCVEKSSFSECNCFCFISFAQ